MRTRSDRRFATRAFTMLEVIAALAIVSTLVVAAVEFTITATKAATARAKPIESDAAARAAMLLLDDAVLLFDTVNNDDPPRIAVTESSVALRTRALFYGAVVREFRLDRMRHALTLSERRVTESGVEAAENERVLATDVAGFEVTFEKRSRALSVRLALRGDDPNRAIERTWRLP